MTTPQSGIFQEGTQFHWFLHFRVRPDASAGAVHAAIRAVQDVANAGSPPETVTLVVAFGRSMLERLAPGEVPAGLHDFTEVTGTSGRTAVATQEDVFFWAHSNRHDRNYEVARDARRAFAAIGELARETPSFVYRESRDLTGFIDGTENPDADEARTLAVIAQGETGEGGCFVLAQRWIHDLDAFHALTIEDQEAVFGRLKVDSTEIEDKAPTAHLSRVVIEDDAGEEIEIYLRSVPYGTATEAGLYFLAFTDDLTKIDRMLANMYGASGDGVHDRVVEFTQTVSGAYYLAPSAEALARILGADA
jgi:putative iron-dependent peroxidase